MPDEKVMFDRYKKYVAEWAERAVSGDEILSFDEWGKRIADGENALIEIVKNTRVKYMTYQYNITELALSMNYMAGSYEKVYLVMRVEFHGYWTASSKVHFNLYVENYNCASWEYDEETEEVKRECLGGNDFLEFLMSPEVCKLFVGKAGVVNIP